MMAPLNEDTLVQATTADYLEEQLGYMASPSQHKPMFSKEATQ